MTRTPTHRPVMMTLWLAALLAVGTDRTLSSATGAAAATTRAP